MTAGMLYAGRSYAPVEKAVVIASGNEVLRKANVSRFSKILDLLGNMQVPSGWDNVPVVVVAWKTL